MPENYWELSKFGHAYRQWRLASQPGPAETAQVKRWARHVTCTGPPGHEAPISDSGEDFTDWVVDTNVFVTYVVSHRDQQVIIRRIE